MNIPKTTKATEIGASHAANYDPDKYGQYFVYGIGGALFTGLFSRIINLYNNVVNAF
jgi:hypothetical protein